MRRESQSFEAEVNRIHDLLLKGRFWTVYDLFRSIGGTRVWENRFKTTDDPLILECVAEDPELGEPIYPNWMLLTKEKFLSCPRGKPDRKGRKTREVRFRELPKIPLKVMKELRHVKG